MLLVLSTGCQKRREAKEVFDAYPEIFPDYKEVTVPYTIAPLNFEVKGADGMRVDVVEDEGDTITFFGKHAVDFSKGWSTLLDRNKGKELRYTVSVWNQEHAEGLRYKPFSLHIAADDIDPHIAYRLIEPGYESWKRIYLCDRTLGSFSEQVYVDNGTTEKACLNCHSFYRYSPDRFLFHVRGKNGGTVFVKDGIATKVDLTKLSSGKQGVYPMWHPDGRYVAFSSNDTFQSFAAQGEQPIEVYDKSSDILLYDTERHEMTVVYPFAADSILRTFPAWSPDGNDLYYCAARAVPLPDSLHRIHYDILRVKFDKAKGIFVDSTDTIVPAEKFSKSASWPRVSPDGNYLMYTQSDYGTFPVWHKEADLKLIRLDNREEISTDVLNSDQAESYHAWSSNGRWILFGSRRLDGRYTRLFIAYFDVKGHLHKPFLLPQKDPEEYTTRLMSYNVPEFVSKSVSLSKTHLRSVFKGMRE